MTDEKMLRQPDEDRQHWFLRCCLAKRKHQTDMEWIEIRDMLGIEIAPDQLRKVAVGVELMHDYQECPYDVATRILSISDAHVPFNLDPEVFTPYINKVDVLVFNGDTEDCFSCSSFPKRFRVGLENEMVAARSYIIEVIDLIHPKKVYINMGNHEYRLARYLTDRLNEEVMSIMPDSPLDLIINDGFHVYDRANKTKIFYEPLAKVYDGSGIEVIYTGDWKCKIGKTLFVHPLTYSSGIFKTTEKAINFFLRTDRDFDTLVMAHTHQLGSYGQGDISMYEQGCCCDISKLDYNSGKLVTPGRQGAIYLCQDRDGNIIQDKTHLVYLD